MQILKTKNGWQVTKNYGWTGLCAHVISVIYFEDKESLLSYIKEVITDDTEYRHVRKDKKVLKEKVNG